MFHVPSSNGDIQGNPSSSPDLPFSAVALVNRIVEEPYIVPPSMTIFGHQPCQTQKNDILISDPKMSNADINRFVARDLGGT